MQATAFALVSILLCAAAPRAESPYALSRDREWVLMGTGAALGITSLILIENVDPLTPEEIGQLDPDDINDFDRRGVNEFRETDAGDAMLYASYLLPLTFFANGETRQDWKMLGVMWAEVTLFNLSINGISKATAQRTRPYVYDPDTPMDRKTTTTARLSFYSGHTASTAANCFFVAKVFNDYLGSTRAKTSSGLVRRCTPHSRAFSGATRATTSAPTSSRGTPSGR